jgi:hypothetical protein
MRRIRRVGETKVIKRNDLEDLTAQLRSQGKFIAQIDCFRGGRYLCHIRRGASLNKYKTTALL